ncbi:MAG: hypothetical protein ABI347_09640 [Nitrososphaera sp.]|jgi:hypothetical protein
MNKIHAITASAILASMLLMIAPTAASYAQPKPTGTSPIAPHTYHGTISSIQPDEKGAPVWIQSGIWTLKIKGNGSAVTGYKSNLTFRAVFDMVEPDGTSMHRHAVSDLKVSGFTNENNVYVINGTATVDMKGTLVKDVPVTIKVMNDSAIAMWIGPARVDNHFGTTPIYGMVAMRPAHR